jgi:hypothetical protein
MPVTPAIQKVENETMPVQGQPGQRVGKNLSQQRSRARRHVPVVPAKQEAVDRWMEGQACARKKCKTYSQKRTESVAQVSEYLPSKYKALNSNCSIIIKKETKRERKKERKREKEKERKKVIIWNTPSLD